LGEYIKYQFTFSKNLQLNNILSDLGINILENTISADQFEVWKHTQLLMDVTKGRGASFSLEILLGLRFVVKSRCFTTGAITQLTPVVCGLPPR
jgi:uncharacterized protein (DUF779 family)